MDELNFILDLISFYLLVLMEIWFSSDDSNGQPVWVLLLCTSRHIPCSSLLLPDPYYAAIITISHPLMFIWFNSIMPSRSLLLYWLSGHPFSFLKQFADELNLPLHNSSNSHTWRHQYAHFDFPSNTLELRPINLFNSQDLQLHFASAGYRVAIS